MFESHIPSQIEIIPSNPTKNTHIDMHYNGVKKNYNIINDKAIPFDDLPADEQNFIRAFCKKQFIREKPRKWYSFFNCSKRENRIEHKKIHPVIFDIVSHLQKECKDCKHIFRVEDKSKEVEEIYNRLVKGERIKYRDLSAKQLSTILKRYITNHLDGLIPEAVSNYLISCSFESSKYQYKALLSCVPYALSREEHLLITEMFKMFSIIDHYKEVTLMDEESLLKLFSLVFFSKSTFDRMDKLEATFNVTIDIFNLDFKSIPFVLINKVIKYI